MDLHLKLNLLPLGVLTVLMLIAATFDLHSRRIPNPLVLIGALNALAHHTLTPASGSWAGAWSPNGLGGLLAAGLMLILGFCAWRAGFWGAGDAKWMAVWAAHGAPAMLAQQILATALAGGLLALAWLAFKRPGPLPYTVAMAAAHVSLTAGAMLSGPP